MPGVDEEDAVRERVLAVLAFCVPGGQGGYQVIAWFRDALLEQPGKNSRASAG